MSVFIAIPKKDSVKKCFNCCTIALISHSSEVMLKVLQARLQQYVNRELPDVQARLEKAEKPEVKLSTSVGSQEKQDSSRKTSPSALLITPKHLTVWITTTCGKYLMRWEYKTNLSASCEICMQVKKQELELDVEQQTGSKSGKKYIKAVYCHHIYLTSLQSTS